ncbi:hypothetical protein FQA39_LY07927 [Lamprigera yunnana]|nr:hypothetical protein FQA39_LY07927 [Lamprigera yunnana]
MAELHVIGNNWKVIAGKGEGQTHVGSSEFEEDCKWCFPIDVHLATRGVQGWPKIFIEIYHLDWWGCSHLYGYGYITVPTSPGLHQVNCFTWRPFGTIRERFTQFFLGGGPQLKNPDLIFLANDRYKLNTEPMGVVCFNLNIILRHFDKFGIEY